MFMPENSLSRFRVHPGIKFFSADLNISHSEIYPLSSLHPKVLSSTTKKRIPRICPALLHANLHTMAAARAFLLLPRSLKVPNSVAGQARQIRHKSSTSDLNPNAVQMQPSPQQTRLPSIADDEQKELLDLRLDTGYMYPNQMDWIDERQVRISKPSKNVMQSGTASTNNWKIEFDSKERFDNWLMGWASTADPLSNMTLSFPTKESAIAFCEKNRLQWFLEEQPKRRIRKKSYADNFAYNKRTRLGNK